VWVGRTVGAMDGAIEPPGMGSRRVLPTHTAPPSTDSRLLLLLWLQQVQGAALPNTLTAPNARSGRNRAD